MQIKSDNLFDLIHSLTASEKRYFKSFVQGASNQQDAKYLLLFDLLVRQKTYDEKSLLHDPLFEQNSNRLAVTKNYLFQLILKSLRNTSTNRNPRMFVFEMLLDIESLYNRRMFAAATKIAEKARKVAEECLFYDSLITICVWERRLTDQIDDGSKYGLIYESILERETHTAQQLRINSIYFGQYKKLYFANLKEGFLKKGKNLNGFLRLLKIPELEDYSQATNPIAKLLYHFCYIEYYLGMREHHNRYQLNKKVMNLFVEYPSLRVASPHYYIKSLIRFLETQLYLKKFEAFDSNIKILRNYKLPLYTHDLIRLKESKSLVFLLHRNFSAGKFEIALDEIIPETKAYFDQYRHQMIFREELILKLQVAWVYIANRDYEKALEWLGALELQINFEYFMDNYTTFCVLNLMIHYDCKDVKAIQDFADELFNFIKSKDKMSSNIAFLIRFFRLAAEDIDDREKQKKLVIQLKEQHLTLKKYIPTLPSYLLECTLWWLDSVLHNKSVATLMKNYVTKPLKRVIVEGSRNEEHSYPSVFTKEGISLNERTNLVE